MPNTTRVIQGLDTIPKAVYDKFKPHFDKYLPGFGIRGEYNFKPSATTQMAAKQAGITLQEFRGQGIPGTQYLIACGNDEWGRCRFPIAQHLRVFV